LTTGGSIFGAACARWKKFHFEGFDGAFSTFSFFTLVFCPSAVRSAEAILASGAPSIALEARDVRRVAKEGKNDLFVSSSLSDGLRELKGVLFIGDMPRTGSDMAEGSSVGRLLSKAARVELFWPFCPSPSAPLTSKLLPLAIGSGLLDNSALLPAPRIVMGASLSRKKSSTSVLVALVTLLLRLEEVRFKLSAVVPALADFPILSPLTELPLLPRTAYLP
jgi:hypothetical protein